MRLRKSERAVAATLCGVLCGLSAGCQSQTKPAGNPPTPVTVAAVEQYTGSEGVNYSVSLVPYVQVSLAFKSGGYVTSILQRIGADGRMRDLQQGDAVKKGTVLATVRQEDYRHAVAQATGQVEQAKAAAAKAREDFARASALYTASALTQPDYDAAKAQNDSARGTLMTARAMLSQAQQALADCELRAPMDSTVLARNVELGTLAAAGTPGFMLGDMHLVKAVFGVPDTILGDVKLGKKQGVLTETYPQEFVGQITSISPQADPKSRTFQVEVTLPNPHDLLKAGMVATLNLGQEKLQHPVLVVPLSAIVSVNDGSRKFSVFVVSPEGGKDVARRRDVQPGGNYGNKVAIVSSVAPGDRVISNGAALVVDGQAVHVIP
jgi:multidrug efflux system membrane fusion protein